RVVQEGTSGRPVDAVVELVGPDQTRAVFVVEAKRSVVTRDLPALLERGVSYVDATGNMCVLLERPALFLHDRGADRDPWRGPGRPRGTLHGPPAARVVRALVDFAPPMTVPELVRRSGASTGATYRVVEFLERDALVDRDPRGPITSVGWRRLLERWSQDYG